VGRLAILRITIEFIWLMEAENDHNKMVELMEAETVVGDAK